VGQFSDCYHFYGSFFRDSACGFQALSYSLFYPYQQRAVNLATADYPLGKSNMDQHFRSLRSGLERSPASLSWFMLMELDFGRCPKMAC
jgi:hypothetical protein